MTDERIDDFDGSEIAVVGMALRVPGANNLDDYWTNLRDGVESVSELTEEELRAAGVTDAELNDPAYVPVRGRLDGAKDFDAALFGFSPRDAAIMDPQHRHFVEVAWEALEHAGYDPARYDGSIGVFGGSGHNAYMPYNILTNPDLVDSVGFFLVRHTGNDKDFLVTRVSYLFDLNGPAVNVQTACSTSLVAVHLGVQSLLAGESDIVLAGGATIEMPLDRGYLYAEGEILSKDGSCRAFDAESSGTVFGSGAGVVVLKRLDDAFADNDTIHAIVRGTAINNDGSNKVGYLAPSVDGQAAAVGEVIALADIDPETIGFIECHGTGTEIGDPIEVAALTQAFRAHTDKTDYCALGSVKTNIGHLDTAAGVASFIKACLALEHQVIPPTVHFQTPNPKIAFDGSPFFVNGEAIDWTTVGDEPRRAGVSSLGVGGTNAHVILEEAPELDPTTNPTRAWQILPLSAKGPTALDEATSNLADFLAANTGSDLGSEASTGAAGEAKIELADVAHTLQVGRRALDARRFVVAESVADAAAVLGGEEPKRIHTGTAPVKDRPVVFMFPGQGAQFADMGRGLYEAEPVFRDAVDSCADILDPVIGFDLRTVLYPDADGTDPDNTAANDELTRTATTQPAIFTIEYAMAKLWMSWGVEPTAMIGHSIGEYTAACLAGVFTLEDALKVVATRGRLMQELPAGSMLAIPQAADEVEPHLDADLSLAALNGPEFSVVAGPDAAIDALQAKLEAADVAVRRLHTSHAFHSSMMDPMLDSFAEVVAGTRRGEPTIPFVTNVTGTWVTGEQIVDPDHWATHVRGAVNFVGGLRTILDQNPEAALLEVGPGRTLATFAKQVDGPHRKAVVTSMRHATGDGDDVALALSAFGELWATGAVDDWASLRGDETRRRIPLPTYPFQHQEFWVEPGENIHRSGGGRSLAKKPDIADWFYLPTWSQTPPPVLAPPAADQSEQDGDGDSEASTVTRWLLFADEAGLSTELAERLGRTADEAGGPVEVITVARGTGFDAAPTNGASAPDRFVIDPDDRSHYGRLFAALSEGDRLPTGIVNLWPIDADDTLDPTDPGFAGAKTAAFHSQLFCAQALGDEGVANPIDWWAVTNNAHAVTGTATTNPVQALALGPVKVIGQEYPHITCRNLDIVWAGATRTAGSGARAHRALVSAMANELQAQPDDDVIALRGHARWVQSYAAAPRSPSPEGGTSPDDNSLIVEGGTYLITGGTAGIGIEIAEHLAQTASAKLVLISRSALPERTAWDAWIEDHPRNDPTSRKLMRLIAVEEAGAELLVAATDVCDGAQMGQVVAEAVERFGGIDGVFHAAGHLADGLITMKEREEAESVLAAKVTGTLALDRALADAGAEPEFLALFSSVSAIAGIAGQVDYAAANAFLNAYAHHRDHSGRFTVAIGWGPWQEIGMTVRTAIGLGLMEDAEAMIEPDHSLLDRWYEKDDEDVFETELSPDEHWLLDEHRALSGVAILPGTGYLDLVAAAHDQRRAGESYEIADLFFLAPCMVADGEHAALRTSVDRNRGDFVISSTGPGGAQEHARGRIATIGDDTTPDPVDVDAIRARCTKRLVEFERAENPQLVWGPRWNVLRSIEYGATEVLATIRLPHEYRDDLVDHRLHPAVLDHATTVAQELIAGYRPGTDFFVPFSYGRLRHHRPLTETMFSHARYRPGDDDETAVFDIALLDGDGNVLVEVNGFVMRRAVGEIAEAVSAEAAPTVVEPIMESIANGIAPSEGMQALRRVLSGPLVPELAVVSQDLHAIIRRSAEAASAGGDGEGGTGISHERPDVSTPFVAPSTERETAVATIWEEMLGVSGVGIHDDFFELGGHSLLLTQAITRIKKLTEADVSLFTLFEASTISELIVEIEKAEAEEANSGGAAAPKLARVSRDEYRTQVGSLQNKAAPSREKDQT